MTPKEARAKWVEALRSGRYEQGHGCLRESTGGRESTEGRYRYCCLGVACDVYRELTGKGHWRERTGGYGSSLWVSPDGSVETAGLSSEVQVFFGVDACGRYGGRYGDCTSLMRANDNSGKSLSEIADIIEAEPEGLVQNAS